MNAVIAQECDIDMPVGMHVFERGWLSANNILFMDRGDAALVDSGYLTQSQQTVALVEQRLAGQPLRRLINTHLHSDHCGGNAALQRRWQPRTWIPAGDAAAVSAWDEGALSFTATGQQCEPFRYDHVLRDGEILRLATIDWQILAAPGHDAHAVMLYAPQERILISGDALWENGFGVIFPELDGESGFAEQHAVLERIAGLDVRLVVPGHGRPFTNIDSALELAVSRIGYLRADPARNATNALKVLLAFRVLEQQYTTRDALLTWMTQTPLIQRISIQYLCGQAPAEILDTAISTLKAARALKLDGNWIRPSE
ncbi:MBL fold metallo-hydrolase [Burkholderia pyrrocinia]|uniref:MBL fold metallo-hydrolase n=1 Tax=Burkholderia pyrrocinia TaxID=60550 RepID=UPI001FC87FC1|nr:MBL fold metallo-hydrolase [Burkholderia pyrrocinia]